jgi:UDP-GlcNAc:undecaprenyl-phosphate GlcNAc-1-phosphate transferase
MLSILILCAVAGLLAAGLTPLVRLLAVFAGVLDLPSARKVHARETPRTGGLAIAVAYLLTTGIAAVWKRFDPSLPFAPGENARLMLGAVPMLLVGLADDLYGLRARWKLALEIAVASLMVALGLRIDLVSLPFVGSVETGVLGVPLTVFWIVAVVNAINLIDGLDGLASGIALIAVAANGVIALRLGRPEIAMLLLVTGGALLGFLRHNLHPATIFLGDCGSLFLGFLLATLSLRSCQKGPTAIAIVLPMLTIALPLADAVAAFLRRTLAPGTGAWWTRLARAFHPDRQHVHHRLLRLGFGHAETVTLLHLVCLLFAAISVAVASVPQIGARFILLYAAVVTAAVARKLGLFGRRATVAARATGPSGPPAGHQRQDVVLLWLTLTVLPILLTVSWALGR